MQESFSKLWGSNSRPSTEGNLTYANDTEAKAARDALYQELKKQGIKSKRSQLKGQLRKYWSFGVSCGSSCTVYYLNW